MSIRRTAGIDGTTTYPVSPPGVPSQVTTPDQAAHSELLNLGDLYVARGRQGWTPLTPQEALQRPVEKLFVKTGNGLKKLTEVHSPAEIDATVARARAAASQVEQQLSTGWEGSGPPVAAVPWAAAAETAGAPAAPLASGLGWDVASQPASSAAGLASPPEGAAVPADPLGVS